RRDDSVGGQAKVRQGHRVHGAEDNGRTGGYDMRRAGVVNEYVVLDNLLCGGVAVAGTDALLARTLVAPDSAGRGALGLRADAGRAAAGMDFQVVALLGGRDLGGQHDEKKGSVVLHLQFIQFSAFYADAICLRSANAPSPTAKTESL
ncbi:hypothetical protein THAOC_01218, partial [Thalassiosira oceanica]